MNILTHQLQQLGLSPKQAEVFLSLYQYGPKPASSVAKLIGGERTNTYKLIQGLLRQGLLAETTKHGIKQFYVPNKEVLRNRLDQQKREMEAQEELLPRIEHALTAFDEQRASPIPKMRFFEGKDGIQHLFDDVLGLIHKRSYVMIKYVASNTLESQSMSTHQLQEFSEDFFQELKKKHIHVETYLGNGILTLEQMLKTHDIAILPSLPAGNASVHICIVGDTLYLMIFKQVPFGLKIESESLADMMHFLLKQVA